MTARRTIAAANAACAAMAALCDGGYLDLYDGAQPASADISVDEKQKLLASIPLGAPAFSRVDGGIALSDALRSDLDAKANGRARWFRVYGSDHATSVFDGSVGTSNGEAILSSTAILQHSRVDCVQLTLAEAT